MCRGELGQSLLKCVQLGDQHIRQALGPLTSSPHIVSDVIAHLPSVARDIAHVGELGLYQAPDIEDLLPQMSRHLGHG